MRRRSLWTALAVLALMVGACGDDGGATQNQTQTSEGGANEGEPVSGGELTVLFPSERASMDPINSRSSSGSTALGDFALYGALIVYEADSNEIVPILAESLESNDTFDVWTLTLRSGLTFTDGTPFNAEAVKVNWERAQDPANRSTAIGLANQITEMNAIDDVTLEITLASPDSSFNFTLSRESMNHVASAEAIRSGHDLSSDPIGAGPFMLESWTRDDRQVYARNPGWYDAPRPYVDRMVIRTIPDEGQTLDTFLTGDADAMFATVEDIISRGEEAGAHYQGQRLGHPQYIGFNASRPPFDDVRMRQFVAAAVDWQALIETIDSADAQTATNLTVEGTPWYTDKAALPDYDQDAAQALLDDYVAEHGAVEANCLNGQSSRSIAQCKFLQTALNQYDGINITVDSVDTPTSFVRATAGDYDMNVWGGPVLNPGGDLSRLVQSGSASNTMHFSNAEVDALFAEARLTGDVDEQNDIYRQIYEILGAELPFRPIGHSRFGHLLAENVHGGHHYNDGALRTDLLWMDQ